MSVASWLDSRPMEVKRTHGVFIDILLAGRRADRLRTDHATRALVWTAGSYFGFRYREFYLLSQ